MELIYDFKDDEFEYEPDNLTYALEKVLRNELNLKTGENEKVEKLLRILFTDCDSIVLDAVAEQFYDELKEYFSDEAFESYIEMLENLDYREDIKNGTE